VIVKTSKILCRINIETFRQKRYTHAAGSKSLTRSIESLRRTPRQAFEQTVGALFECQQIKATITRRPKDGIRVMQRAHRARDIVLSEPGNIGTHSDGRIAGLECEL
jgi:hypothetical protein